MLHSIILVCCVFIFIFCKTFFNYSFDFFFEPLVVHESVHHTFCCIERLLIILSDFTISLQEYILTCLTTFFAYSFFLIHNLLFQFDHWLLVFIFQATRNTPIIYIAYLPPADLGASFFWVLRDILMLSEVYTNLIRPTLA